MRYLNKTSYVFCLLLAVFALGNASLQAQVPGTPYLLPAEPVITASNIVYNGVSVIDQRGIGYNGEMVPASSTINLLITVSGATIVNLSATHPGTGLTYSAGPIVFSGGTLSQIVTLIHNGPMIPWDTSGTLTLPLTGVDNAVTLSPRIDIKSLPAASTTIVDVGIDTDNADSDNDPTTGTFEQTWMDRNLGAHRAATALNDGFGYGNLYQWGRGNDGHELVVTHGDNPAMSKLLNTTTTTLATTPTPGHSNFIVSTASPYDWITPQNATLWQGVSGTNNPCPSGYRLPTHQELLTMVTATGIGNTSSAASSPLQFPAAGFNAFNSSVMVGFEATSGYYWSSNANSSGNSILRRFTVSFTEASIYSRGSSLSVRCIKN